MKTFGFSTSLAVTLALTASPLMAQPAAPAPPPPAASPAAPALSDALQGPAKQEYESAKLLASNHDFSGALAQFGDAYKLSKDPRLLFNMAICEKELHHYARMKVTLDQYLHDGANVATADSLAAAQDALAAIRPLVAAIQLKVNEKGADVSVDGETVGTSPIAGSIPVDFGRHQVSVKKSGFDPIEQTVETPGGSEAVVQIDLVAQRHVAQLAITASSTDSTLLVDGTAVGAQGHFDGSVPSGTHDVNVVAPGKRPYRAQIELRDGERRTLDVTLEEEAHGGSAWPWIIGTVVVAAGGAVGGYFLFKPQDQTTPVPKGQLNTVMLNAWRP
jgi:hypothetical protein